MKEEQKQIQENTLRIKDLRAVNFLFFGFIVGIFIMGLTIHYEAQNRLNEQKRLLIAQQEQINKLILNAEYNKLINEKKVR